MVPLPFKFPSSPSERFFQGMTHMFHGSQTFGANVALGIEYRHSIQNVMSLDAFD
jgi:hypothetical protein